jgi:hypothetical protein
MFIQNRSRFAACSQRFVDAYASDSNGKRAIEWATKEFQSHRQTPAHIPYKQIASVKKAELNLTKP